MLVLSSFTSIVFILTAKCFSVRGIGGARGGGLYPRYGWPDLLLMNDGCHGARNPGLISRAVAENMAPDLTL